MACVMCDVFFHSSAKISNGDCAILHRVKQSRYEKVADVAMWGSHRTALELHHLQAPKRSK